MNSLQQSPASIFNFVFVKGLPWLFTRFPFPDSPNSVCDIYLNREKVPLFLIMFIIYGTIGPDVARKPRIVLRKKCFNSRGILIILC